MTGLDLYGELKVVLDTLLQAKIDFALCGGLAVALHGYVRYTRDIDVLIQKKDVDRAAELLGKKGFVFTSGIIPFKTGTPEATELFRVSKIIGEDVLTVDLMIVAPVLESVWATRQTLEWEGRRIGVVSRDGLLRMKRLAGRPRDLNDIQELGLEKTDGD